MADFVANFTVAAFAPIMGFSACFGGPMLNIMLGIGLSGSLVINQTGKSYVLEFSHTLLSSSIGLLCLLVATMIWVPYNNFMLTKGWGIFLIATYAVIMSVNVCVEIYSKKW
jgi:sodium/potassium/calcium exchanger 6